MSLGMKFDDEDAKPVCVFASHVLSCCCETTAILRNAHDDDVEEMLLCACFDDTMLRSGCACVHC